MMDSNMSKVRYIVFHALFDLALSFFSLLSHPMDLNVIAILPIHNLPH